MATVVTTASGFTFQDYPVPNREKPPSIVHAEDEATGHMVNLDITNNNLDEAHLVLKGNLPSGHFYIKCEDTSNVSKFTVDKDGKIDCDGLDLPIIGDVESEIQGNTQTIAANFTQQQITHVEMEQNETQISFLTNAHTILDDKVGTPTEFLSDPVTQTIVRRAAAGNNTEIEKILCHQLASVAPNPSIAVYGAGRIDWVPTDGLGDPLSNDGSIIYRLGSDVEFLGDTSNRGDGLHFKADSNEVLMQVNKTTPTIRLDGEKNAGVNYLECINESQATIFAISKTGALVGTHQTAVNLHLGRTTDLEAFAYNANSDIDILETADTQNVKITGNQIITGAKTFDGIYLTGPILPADGYESQITMGSKTKPFSSIRTKILQLNPTSM